MSATTTTKERPILFSAPMVRALLDGAKTQTRRILKPQPAGPRDCIREFVDGWYPVNRQACGEMVVTFERWDCHYGAPGDELFVKETWRTKSQWDGLKPRYLPIANEFMVSPFIAYDADGPSRELHGKTRPSIFMPRWASRITLEIESVRVERLQDISEEDAIAEGVRFHSASKVYGEGLCFDTARHAYAQLWESINGPGSWARNEFVWVLTFKRI